MKKVLLHICCGPCTIFPLEVLTKDGYISEGLFYNPNIQPLAEYLKRKEVISDLENKFNLKVHIGDYEEELYLESIKGAADKYSRCKSCFRLRLKKTQEFAQKNGFDYFTTTLLVSPYQDQQSIKEIGQDLSKDSKAKFLFYDFRSGFRSAHQKARELNFYTQKYCGCLASLEERNQQIQKKKNKNVVC